MALFFLLDFLYYLLKQCCLKVFYCLQFKYELIDPRWGRVAEGAGEDVYLGSLIAAARVKGFQGNSMSDYNTVVACVKHYAAYGATMAGRDYNTVDMSLNELWNTFLPPFKAALDAGCGTIMTSFNDVDN